MERLRAADPAGAKKSELSIKQKEGIAEARDESPPRVWPSGKSFFRTP